VLKSPTGEFINAILKKYDVSLAILKIAGTDRELLH